jgi:PST family polysaccharide transporter
MQFASYVLPPITVPYLVRVLKPERFGTVAFGQSLIAYFMALVEYGFGLSATRRILLDDEKEIRQLDRVANQYVVLRGQTLSAPCLLWYP